MNRRPARLATLAALLVAAACSSQGTEIVLLVSTDFEVPEEVDELYLRLSSPDPAGVEPPYEWEQTYPLGADPGESFMPATLAVRPGSRGRTTVDFHGELRKDGVTLVEGDVSAGFRDGESVEVELFLGREAATACPNDPPAAGTVGQPCAGPADCAGTYCLDDSAGFPDGYCLGQADPTAPCEQYPTDSCPAGSKCIYFGNDARTGRALMFCLDRCAVASAGREAYRTNCDCRDGYACSAVGEVCLPGCTTDEECCLVWRDANGNGIAEDSEFVPFEPCDGWCDHATALCDYGGDRGAPLGGPCEHDSQCPPPSRCISEAEAPELIGGICLRQRCDLAGYECDGGSACVDLGTVIQAWPVCLPGCRVGSSPGEDGFTCRPELACWPAADFLQPAEDFPAADGYCWAGNWTPVETPNVYSSCTGPADCYSPFGLATCLSEGPGLPGYCTVQGCDHPAVEPYCGPGGTCPTAIGIDYCLASCTPGVAMDSSGCPAGFACWDFYGLPACYFPCSGAADCPSATCNPVSRGCEYRL